MARNQGRVKKVKKRCPVCGRAIHGKVYYWAGAPRCKNCYSYFCKKVRKL